MQATAIWNSNLSFTAKADSGFPVQLDSDNGVRPMELIAIGLAGCTGMDVISILQKKQQNVTQFETRVDAPRSKDHPKVFTSAVVTYSITGKDVDEEAVLRAIELSATKYCPVQAMLEQAFPIDLRYEIYEDEGDGNPTLAYQGIWQELTMESIRSANDALTRNRNFLERSIR